MQESHHIDACTWDQFRNGDKSAYAVIYRIYYPALYNYGKKMFRCEHLVEDGLQEVFTRFWMNRHQLSGVQQIQPYLFASFRNHIIKAIRQLQRHKEHEEQAFEFELVLSADQMLINKEHIYEQSICLQQAMAQLTSRQKEAVYFKFYENMSYEDIALILGITTKAIYKLMARSVAELRKVYLLQQANSIARLLAVIIGNTYCFL